MKPGDRVVVLASWPLGDHGQLGILTGTTYPVAKAHVVGYTQERIYTVALDNGKRLQTGLAEHFAVVAEVGDNPRERERFRVHARLEESTP